MTISSWHLRMLVAKLKTVTGRFDQLITATCSKITADSLCGRFIRFSESSIRLRVYSSWTVFILVYQNSLLIPKEIRALWCPEQLVFISFKCLSNESCNFRFTFSLTRHRHKSEQIYCLNLCRPHVKISSQHWQIRLFRCQPVWDDDSADTHICTQTSWRAYLSCFNQPTFDDSLQAALQPTSAQLLLFMMSPT